MAQTLDAVTFRPAILHRIRAAAVLLAMVCACSVSWAQLELQSRLPVNLENVPGVGPVKPVPTVTAEGAQTAPAAANAPKPAAPAAVPPPLPSAKMSTGPVAQLYLYVEPYQTRVEALFDMNHTFDWLSPDERPRPAKLTPQRQQQIIKDAERLAVDWCTVETNTGRQPTSMPTAFFVKGKPGATLPMEENEELAFDECMLGLVWQYTTNETPDTVEMRWAGWINDLKKLPVTTLFGSLSERGEMNFITRNHQWGNKGRLRPAALVAVPTFDPGQPVRIPVGLVVWLVAGAAFWWWIWHRDYRLPGGSLPYFGVWLFGLVLFGKLLTIDIGGGDKAPHITDAAAAQKIVSPLLRNVYRAFDHRVESRVYDVLARSVDGELLRKLYLDTIQALTLDGREGTRVLITEFEATVDKVTPDAASGGFVADCNWSVLGNVGHWGHAHPRYNGYKARATISPLKGEWKLTALEVLEVRRK